jgi:hypothetical protein
MSSKRCQSEYLYLLRREAALTRKPTVNDFIVDDQPKFTIRTLAGASAGAAADQSTTPRKREGTRLAPQFQAGPHTTGTQA